jgi:hypothetical protein
MIALAKGRINIFITVGMIDGSTAGIAAGIPGRPGQP